MKRHLSGMKIHVVMLQEHENDSPIAAFYSYREADAYELADGRPGMSVVSVPLNPPRPRPTSPYQTDPDAWAPLPNPEDFALHGTPEGDDLMAKELERIRNEIPE